MPLYRILKETELSQFIPQRLKKPLKISESNTEDWQNLAFKIQKDLLEIVIWVTLTEMQLCCMSKISYPGRAVGSFTASLRTFSKEVKGM